MCVTNLAWTNQTHQAQQTHKPTQLTPTPSLDPQPPGYPSDEEELHLRDWDQEMLEAEEFLGLL